MAEKRAQAAMEFLMTYGWAILVIIIVVAVLFYMGVLNPNRMQTDTLMFAPGHTAYTFGLAPDTGDLSLDFGQALGKSIMVTGISCSQATDAGFQYVNPQIVVPSGEHRPIASLGSGITCTNENDDPLDPANAQAGERYKGRVCVAYTELDTDTNRVVCGDISAKFGYTGGSGGGGGGTPTPTGTATATPTGTATGTPTETPTATPSENIITVCDPNTPWPGGSLIDTPGTYTISPTLPQSTDTCISISSGGSGSTLDCHDRSITGPGSGMSYGIFLLAAHDVTVENCDVSGFRVGIAVQAGQNNHLVSNGLTQNVVGIGLYSTDSNTLTDNSATSNSDTGIYVSGSGNTFDGNTATGNPAGFYCTSTSSNIDSGNTCSSQSGCSVAEGGWLCSCPIDTCATPTPTPTPRPPDPPGCVNEFNQIVSCPCDIYATGDYTLAGPLSPSGADHCISFFGASGGSLDCGGAANTVSGPGNRGIILAAWVNEFTIRNCYVTGFTMAGIRIRGASNILQGNNLYGNERGVWLYNIVSNGPANDNNFAGNTITSNTVGIELGGEPSEGNTFQGNTICNNPTAFSCDTHSVSDAGSNTCDGGPYCTTTPPGVTCAQPCSELTPTPTPTPECPVEGCDDFNACTTDTCGPETDFMCVHTPITCDDQNPCTSDWCEPADGCHYDPLNGPQPDCDGAFTCESGSCNPAPAWPACAPGGVVTTCPCNLNVAGTYTMTSNINSCLSGGGGWGDAIDITVPGVTLNCNNFGITAVSSSDPNDWKGNGITLAGVSGDTVENCHVNHYTAGITLSGASSNQVLTNTISSNDGVYITGDSNSNTVQGNTIGPSGNHGIAVEGGTGNQITSNIISSSGMYGIRVIVTGAPPAVATLTNNQIGGSSEYDILCDMGDTVTRSGNTCSTSGKQCWGCVSGTCNNNACN